MKPKPEKIAAPTQALSWKAQFSTGSVTENQPQKKTPTSTKACHAVIFNL